ncbi:unnamed protein product [Diamesa serratosioi]
MNLLTIGVLFATVVVLANAQQHDPNYCFVTDPIRRQLGMFSSRTAYEINRGRSINPAVSSCTPSRFWFYTRHAARLPGVNDINRINAISTQHQRIITAYNAGRSSLCPEDFQLIQNWRFDPNITVDKEQWLTVAGWNEMSSIAQRYQRAFPTLLPSTYNRNRISFRNTNRQRTQATVRAFADGIFGFNGYQQVTFEPTPDPDRVLRPHDGCSLYDAVSGDTSQRESWQRGAEFQLMLSQVNTKLGLTGNQLLTPRQLRTLWDICNFEQLWNLAAPAPYCGAFSVNNNAILEYFEDLEYYYTVGYGGPRRLFENLNCHIMQDMLQYLQSNNANDQQARIFSTHSTPLQLLLVTLGVFEDSVPLTWTNFAQQALRQWRSSYITPMAANLAVIRYDCPNGDNDVLFMFNEKPLVIPGCQSNGLCKVSFILQRYSRFLNANCASLYCSNN